MRIGLSSLATSLLLTGLAGFFLSVTTVRSVSVLPATCNPGGGAGGAPADHADLWNGSVNVPYFCSATNTWSPYGAGAGSTTTIANGTAALGTSAIGPGVCASVVTVSAAGVASTDDIMADFPSDPTGTSGFIPGSMLTIIKWPSASAVNFKECNNTTSSITPAALSLRWRVVR